MLNIKIVPQVEYPSLGEQYKSRKKIGRYHNSMFWDVPDFGTKKWMVVVKVDIGNRDILLGQMTEEELTSECLKIINPKRPRKKVHLHGNLEFFKFEKRLGSKNEANLILTINERRHKSFWGEGTYVSRRKKRK